MGERESSCVRYLECLAEKIERSRIYEPLVKGERAGRFKTAESAAVYGQVLAEVRGGVGIPAACRRAGVTEKAFRSWADRLGHKFRRGQS